MFSILTLLLQSASVFALINPGVSFVVVEETRPGGIQNEVRIYENHPGTAGAATKRLEFAGLADIEQIAVMDGLPGNRIGAYVLSRNGDLQLVTSAGHMPVGKATAVAPWTPTAVLIAAQDGSISTLDHKGTLANLVAPGVITSGMVRVIRAIDNSHFAVGTSTGEVVLFEWPTSSQVRAYRRTNFSREIIDVIFEGAVGYVVIDSDVNGEYPVLSVDLSSPSSVTTINQDRFAKRPRLVDIDSAGKSVALTVGAGLLEMKHGRTALALETDFLAPSGLARSGIVASSLKNVFVELPGPPLSWRLASSASPTAQAAAQAPAAAPGTASTPPPSRSQLNPNLAIQQGLGFLTLQEPLANGNSDVIVHAIDTLSAGSQTVLWFSIKQDLDQIAVLDGGAGGKVSAYGLLDDGQAKELVFATNTQVKPLGRALAIAPFASDKALVVAPSNEITLADGSGRYSLVVPARNIPAKHGAITAIRRIDDRHFAVGTDAGSLLVFGQDVFLQWHIVGAASFPASIIEILIDGTNGWVALDKDQQGLYDIKTLDLSNPNSPLIKSGGQALSRPRFLDLNPNTALGWFLVGPNLHEISFTGARRLVRSNFFNASSLNAAGIRATNPKAVLFEAPGFTLDWRQGMTVSMLGATAVTVPVGSMAQATPSAPKAVLGTAPKTAQLPATGAKRKVVLDPVEPAEFRQKFEQEAKSNGLPFPRAEMPVTDFVDWINRTTSLRYYFADIPADVLQGHGILYRGYSLKVIAGMEWQKVSLDIVVHQLSSAAKAKARTAGCESKLKP